MKHSGDAPPMRGDALQRWIEKLRYLERELATTANPSTKFQLRNEIDECHREIQRLQPNAESADKSPPVARAEPRDFIEPQGLLGNPAKTTDRSSDPHRHGTGEPPPLIKHTIWLFDPENWRMYWKQITVALLVAIALALSPKIIDRKPKPSVSDYPVVSTPTTSTSSEPDAGHKAQHPGPLSQDQIRAAIMKALDDDKVPAAINLLADIREAGVKGEECRHVFDFCIKNGRFEYLDALKKQCPEVR